MITVSDLSKSAQNGQCLCNSCCGMKGLYFSSVTKVVVETVIKKLSHGTCCLIMYQYSFLINLGPRRKKCDGEIVPGHLLPHYQYYFLTKAGP